jgi:hypothetical protein
MGDKGGQMANLDYTLTIVRDQRHALIRDEVRAASQREQLERAVREAILSFGCGIDEVSEASGLRPSEIRTLLSAPAPTEDDALALSIG